MLVNFGSLLWHSVLARMSIRSRITPQAGLREFPASRGLSWVEGLGGLI